MKPFVSAAVAVLVSACSSAPPSLVAGRDPGDPSAPVAAVAYVPVTAGTVDYRPVEPKPWGEQNQRVAPQPKGDR